MKPTDLESYRQERQFHIKHFPKENPPSPETTARIETPDQPEFDLGSSATVRLYRFGPTPAEAAVRLEANPTLRSWARDSMESSGVTAAEGRWFSSSRVDAASFSQDHAAYRLRHVDVAVEDAARWKASDMPSVQRFVREPKTDYFLPAIVANQAVRTERLQAIEAPIERSMSLSR